MKISMVFVNNSKPTDFENWLSKNGYFYIKTIDNRPCFKSKLTCKLKEKFISETTKTNTPKKSKIFSFKFRG